MSTSNLNQIRMRGFRHVAEQQKSKQSIRAYCTNHHIPLSTFYYWKRHHHSIHTKKSSHRQQSLSPKFKEVSPSLNNPLLQHSHYRLIFCTGLAIEIPHDFTVARLKEFLGAVSESTPGAAPC